MHPGKTSIMLADDHHLVREAFSKAISTNTNFIVTGQAANGRELLNLVIVKPPDIILLDLKMPEMDGDQTLRILKQKHPDIKVIMVTSYYSVLDISYYMNLGASAYLPKSCSYEDLIKTLNKVKTNGIYLDQSISRKMVSDLIMNNDKNIYEILTTREIEVLQLHCDGKQYKEIAEKLFVSVDDISYHMKEIRRKTGIKSSPQLVKFAIRQSITGLN